MGSWLRGESGMRRTNMVVRSEVAGLVAAGALCGVLIGACGGSGDDDSGAPPPTAMAGSGAPMTGNTAGNGNTAAAGTGGGSTSTAGTTGGFAGISGKPTETPNGNTMDD